VTVDIPAGVRAMAARGPDWQAWVDRLPVFGHDLLQQWDLRADGMPMHGNCSLVLPVRTRAATAAMLKIGFPEQESEHEHLALRRWNGDGTVTLLSADPHRRALLLERLEDQDLTTVDDVEACRIVVALYRRLHVPAMPQLRSLSSSIERWNADLVALPRSAPIPHRLVEQAVALGRDLVADRSVPDRVLHTDLHYANVLAGQRQPWSVIDPKPVNGDPHYEVAPMLWNRWDEIAGNVREGVRRRFWILVDEAGFDEERARDWVIVRMVHNAMWAFQEQAPPSWLTVCIAVAKALQD
jgi:streptomycin 6-kinase